MQTTATLLMAAQNRARRLTRAENRELRRDSLIEAAERVIAEHDLPGTTVERICEQAGVSHGLLGHYFASKDDLLLVVCERAFEGDLAHKAEIAADTSLSAVERLHELAVSTFDPPVYSPQRAAVWQAFLNACRSTALFRQAIWRGAEGYRSVFEEGFSQAAHELGITIDAPRAALGLIALIDGFWTGLSTGKDSATPEDAITLCHLHIDACLDHARPSPKRSRGPDRQAARR